MKPRLLFALLLMGFTSLIVQTLLIREFLITFYGNELTIGIILANWLILEALGSSICAKFALKARQPFSIYALLQTLISVYLPFSIYFSRTVKNLLGASIGEGVGILPIFGCSLFILAPLSILDGMQFPFGCRLWSDFSKKEVESVGLVYILEAMGFIIAGPIFTYIFITKLQSFQIALSLGLLNLLSGMFLLNSREKIFFIRRAFQRPIKKIFSLVMGLLFILCVFMLFSNLSEKLHWSSINKQWKNQGVIDYRNSIYGNLSVTKQEKQYTFFSDGIPIITTPLPDITAVEELVHFAMLSLIQPREVLLLSGGAGGILNEILKYPIERIDYTELDPLLIKMVKEHPTDLTKRELNDPRVKIKYIDGRRFIRITKNKYDLILLNLPLPSNLQLNRFYTQEFFKTVESRLKNQGIFVFGMVGSLSYYSEELRNLNGSLLNTLKDVFPYVDVIPGDTNLYLAGNSPFEINPELIFKRFQENKISSRLITPAYLEYRLHPRWFNWFKESLGDTSKIRKNTDLLPSGVFYGLTYWNALFSQRLQGLFKLLNKLDFKILIGIEVLLGLVIFFLFYLRPKLKKLSIGFAIATTGFVGMSFDLIIIFTYQAFYGFLYHHIALLVTAFMAGLTLGGWLMTKRLLKIKKDILSFIKIELAIMGFTACVGPLLLILNHNLSVNLSFVFFILSFLSGLLVGLEFPLANKIYLGEKITTSAGILYALDLFGAWFACFFICVALVPVIGILKTCLVLIGLKLISLSLLFLD